MNLQEQIYRIQKMMELDELYEPSGKTHKPSKFVYHKSNPMFRENIFEKGLKVSVGDCYKGYSSVFSKEECRPAIFATDSPEEKEWFHSTWDDDTWKIDTEIANVEWFLDRHYDFREKGNKHIVTFEDIKPKALKLIYKGTGQNF